MNPETRLATTCPGKDYHASASKCPRRDDLTRGVQKFRYHLLWKRPSSAFKCPQHDELTRMVECKLRTAKCTLPLPRDGQTAYRREHTSAFTHMQRLFHFESAVLLPCQTPKNRQPSTPCTSIQFHSQASRSKSSHGHTHSQETGWLH